MSMSLVQYKANLNFRWGSERSYTKLNVLFATCVLKNYVCHISNAQLYLKLGIRITKLHKMLYYKQKTWAKPYVDRMSELKKNAKTPMERSMNKALVNIFFGKKIKNVPSRKNIKIVSSLSQLKYYAKSPLLTDVIPISPETILCVLNRGKYVINQPYIVGVQVLECSKRRMSEFGFFVFVHCSNQLVFAYQILTQHIFTQRMNHVWRKLKPTYICLTHHHTIKMIYYLLSYTHLKMNLEMGFYGMITITVLCLK